MTANTFDVRYLMDFVRSNGAKGFKTMAYNSKDVPLNNRMDITKNQRCTCEAR